MFTNIGEASGAIWVVNTLKVHHPDNQEHRPPLVQIPASANSCHGILLSYCPINGMEKLPSYESIIADKRYGIWLTRTPTNVYLPFVLCCFCLPSNIFCSNKHHTVRIRADPTYRLHRLRVSHKFKKGKFNEWQSIICINKRKQYCVRS